MGLFSFVKKLMSEKPTEIDMMDIYERSLYLHHKDVTFSVLNSFQRAIMQDCINKTKTIDTINKMKHLARVYNSESALAKLNDIEEIFINKRTFE